MNLKELNTMKKHLKCIRTSFNNQIIFRWAKMINSLMKILKKQKIRKIIKLFQKMILKIDYKNNCI